VIVEELIKLLQEHDPKATVVMSGDSYVFGDGYQSYELEQGPSVQNVSAEEYAGGACVILWPDRDGWPDV